MNGEFAQQKGVVHQRANMTAKQQPHTTLPEQGDNQQHLDNFLLQPSVNQGEQAGYQPPQASYPPQQESDAPQQASYPLQQGPQQGGYSPQQAGFLPQQAGYPPQQAVYPPQQASYLSGQASHRPPEAGYLPQQGYSPQQTQVINQQPGVIQNTDDATFGESSVRTVCPHCRVTVLTTTQYVPGLTACLCCLLFGIFACCCKEEIMDVQHDCPLCKNKIAVYERSC